MDNFDAKEVRNRIITWIQDWFKKNGEDCKAVIGLSGGKDSSIVATLCKDALGKDRVLGVIMPNDTMDDYTLAVQLAEFLDIQYITVDIGNACRALKHAIKPALDDHWSMQTSTNLPARVRMTTLYAVSQTVKGRVANTCNLSEDWIGYATVFGDAAGDFSPLANLTVQEVKAIGKALGLADKFVEKVPSDGLCGKTDEDNLGFSYAVLDRYIRTGQCDDPNVKALIDRKHQYNLFKLEPMPSFGYAPSEPGDPVSLI